MRLWKWLRAATSLTEPFKELNEISKVRFDALAAYCRSPLMPFFAEELQWFESPDRLLVSTLIRDTDNKYSGIILSRDLRERFRFVTMMSFFDSQDEALEDMNRRAVEVVPTLDEERKQGDEEGPPVDFFTPVRPPEKLSEDFARIASAAGYSPAREIIEPMMRWYEDIDGNFVEQFQTTAFDARIWELYLFAVLTEAGYLLDRSYPAPDFVVSGPRGEFCIEATTVNPSRDAEGNIVPPPPTDTQDEWELYSNEYVPIRYAGPLNSKLKRRYWESPHVAGNPLAIAIMDFHAPMSMTWTRGGLANYLYGYAHDASRDEQGSLVITPRKIEKHSWGRKKIESGFFFLPEAQNISAVIFNNSATISKFNRMGQIAGFGSPRVRLVRQGTVLDHDPNASEPKQFSHHIDPSTYKESWIEGMDVFHNPRADVPLDPEALPGAAHHHLRDDLLVESRSPEWHPLGSVTFIGISDET